MSETIEAVVLALNEAFEKHMPGPLRIDILEAEVKHENGIWQIPVRPKIVRKYMYDLYNDFAEIEIDLDDNKHMKVLLLPALR